MSSLSLGQVIVGARSKYRLIERLGTDWEPRSAVFKAEALSRSESEPQPKWVVVKAALPDVQGSVQELNRELETYQKLKSGSDRYLRECYDTADNPQALVLEYMEYTLAYLKYGACKRSYRIIKAIIEATLRACVMLDEVNLVDTDMRPDKIMISNINSDNPLVKLGDLGRVHLDGSCIQVQRYAMRAPEVYQGHPCTHLSIVWSVAATLMCWIKPGTLGYTGNRMPLYRDSYCIAKLMRLFPHWSDPPTTNPLHRSEFELAKAYILEEEPGIIKIGTLEAELQTVEMFPELRNLLLRLFVVETSQRLSAAEVLVSEEYLALAAKAR